jgi:flavin-dependent thymidylate synthase
MYTSQPIKAAEGPRVTVLSAPSDPLGLIAAQAKTYVGEFVDDLAHITDEERRHYLGEIQKTALTMPLEAVLFNFSITGVTRSFTHQMVRQRTAAYAQESMRFSVVEDSFVDRVALPPSLANTTAKYHEVEESERIHSGYAGEWGTPSQIRERLAHAMTRESKEENWRWKWDEAVHALQKTYSDLINSGMPAEDARGLLPHNITTRIKYNTNMRALLEHIGLRTCTQAQFEWRGVAFQMMQALRTYGRETAYRVKTGTEIGLGTSVAASRHASSEWQYDEIAKLFSPICYRKGKCTMMASFDRKCSIRERVEANASVNRPSTEWHLPLYAVKGDRGEALLVADEISPSEWMLDPGAAR